MEAVRRAFGAIAGSTRRQPAWPNFAELLGSAAWNRLPAAVRERFPAVHSADEYIEYVGTMNEVHATTLGRIVAWLTSVFGTPVATNVGSNVRTVVRVYPNAKVKGIVWERIYHFAGRSAVTVRSTKRLDRDGGMIEALGRGLRMRLRVSEHNGTLRFTSTGYYLECLGIRMPLPRWLPPGTTHVIHTDEGGGRFRFTMYTEHPWFGRMFFQEGEFSDAQERLQ